MRVGFVDLGNVGGKLARSLLRNNFGLTVRDLDENLTKLVTDLKLKCNTLTDILNKSSIFTYDIPNGGYCLWIKK